MFVLPEQIFSLLQVAKQDITVSLYKLEAMFSLWYKDNVYSFFVPHEDQLLVSVIFRVLHML